MMELKVLSCSDDFPSSFSTASLHLLSLQAPPSHSLSFIILPSSLTSHRSVPCSLLTLLPSPFLCPAPCSGARTWPNTRNTLQGHISCRKSRWVSREAENIISSAQPELGPYHKICCFFHHVVG